MLRTLLPCLVLVSSPLAAAQETPPGWRLIPPAETTEKVAIPTKHDGFVLRGELHNIAMLRVQNGEGPVVVIVPGDAPADKRFMAIARELESHGIATLLVEFRQHACRAPNRCASVTAEKIRDDVGVLFAWAQKYAHTPMRRPNAPKCLIAVSHADGAAHVQAAMAAGAKPAVHINITNENTDQVHAKVADSLYATGCWLQSDF